MKAEITNRLHAAMDLSDEEQWQEAIVLFNQVIAEAPELSQAWIERGMTWLNLGENHKALQDFEKVLTLEPDYPGGRSWYASTLNDLQEHKKAAETKLAALRAQPDGKYNMGVSPQDWKTCADYYCAAGDFEKAAEVLQEYFEGYADKVRAYAVYETAPLRLYARLLLDKGDLQTALQKAKEAVASAHSNPADIEMYIEALIRNGNKGEGEKLLNEYVQDIHGGLETESIKGLRSLLQA